jgi:hypothetical protein
MMKNGRTAPLLADRSPSAPPTTKVLAELTAAPSFASSTTTAPPSADANGKVVRKGSEYLGKQQATNGEVGKNTSATSGSASTPAPPFSNPAIAKQFTQLTTWIELRCSLFHRSRFF